MKRKRLALRSERIRELTDRSLGGVQGGLRAEPSFAYSCVEACSAGTPVTTCTSYEPSNPMVCAM